MENFNKQRFLQVAKWDLTINYSFYRNLAIVTLSGIMAITIFGFYIRWMMEDNYYMKTGNNTTESIMIFITYFIGIMMIFFAGCINHPLRNKQGRISTLTIPATNMEKFLWHALMMTIGGYIFCLLCIIAADAIYILLSFMIFPADEFQSITLHYVYTLFGSPNDDFEGIINAIMQKIKSEGIINTVCLRFWTLSVGISPITIFAFGNAIKYRNNIILTIIVLTGLQFAFSILFFTCIILFGENIWDFLLHYAELYFTKDMLPSLVNGIMISGGILLLGFNILLWRLSYRMYCRAQVTSNINKN